MGWGSTEWSGHGMEWDAIGPTSSLNIISKYI